MRQLRALLLVAGMTLMAATTALGQNLVSSYQACSIAGTEAPPPYGLRLDGFYDGQSSTEVTFHFDRVYFDRFDDGSARLHGTISVAEFNNSGASGGTDLGPGPFADSMYTLDVKFVSTTGSNASYEYFLIDPDAGTELIKTDNAGDFAELWSYPLDGSKPFQVGIGANGKNGNYGASGWLNYEHDWNGTIYGTQTQHFTASDFLMDLKPIPEPSSLALLGLGLAGGVARLRRRKSKTAFLS